ncbi:MAG: hypothetical protein ABIP74_03925 [Candidatus Saccharimonas sp.]
MSTPTKTTPVKVRAIIASILVVLMLLGIVIFLLGYSQIKAYTLNTKQMEADAQASNTKVQRLIATKKQLEQNSAIVARASQLVSVSQSYLYQDQIIRDINSYASAAGITLDSITFNEAAAAGTTVAGASVPPAGIKITTASVVLKNPVNYTRYLNFIHSLEQSLFRMSVLGVSLTRSASSDELKKDPEAMTAEPVSIEVYIK